MHLGGQTLFPPIIQNPTMSIDLDPQIWGPPFWFFLHSITLTYPEHPNEVTKRKYYDFINNLPLFLPMGGNKFAEMLDLYPLTPYLSSRESFVRWMIFIHNKYNHWLGKPPMEVMEALDHYYESYYSPTYKEERQVMFTRNHIIALLVFLFFILIIRFR